MRIEASEYKDSVDREYPNIVLDSPTVGLQFISDLFEDGDDISLYIKHNHKLYLYKKVTKNPVNIRLLLKTHPTSNVVFDTGSEKVPIESLMDYMQKVY